MNTPFHIPTASLMRTLALAVVFTGATLHAQPRPDEKHPDAPAAQRPGKGESRESEGSSRRSERPPLSDAQRDFILEMLSAWRPESAERLREMREHRPADFRIMVDRYAMSDRIRGYLDEQRRDPVGSSLRLAEWKTMGRVQRLTAELRNTPDGDSDRVKAELRVAIEAQYDARLKMREHELEQTEMRLEELRMQIEESKANKQQAVDDLFERTLHPPASDSPTDRPPPRERRPFNPESSDDGPEDHPPRVKDEPTR